MAIQSHRNSPWWVTEVEPYEEACLNGMLWKLASKSSMLTNLAYPSYTKYCLISLSWYWYSAVHLLIGMMLWKSQ